MHFASTFDARESCPEEERPARLFYNEIWSIKILKVSKGLTEKQD